jgi:hypothetical protein
MELYMSEEKCVVSTKAQSLLRKAEAAKATRESKLDAQRAAEKKNREPWYFTHS